MKEKEEKPGPADAGLRPERGKAALRFLGNRWLALALLSLCVFAAAYWLLVREPAGERRLKGAPVATLSFARNEVDVRYAGEFRWRKPRGETGLVADDAVKTHDMSAALLEFGPNSFLKIDENSLVLVRAPGELSESVVEIQRGAVEGSLRHPVLVRSGGGDALITPGEGGVARFEQVVRQGGREELRILEGAGQVTSAGVSSELQAGQVGIMEAEQVVEVRAVSVPAVFGPPDRGTIRLAATGETEVRFRFGEEGKQYRLEVARDPQFTGEILAERAAGPGYQTAALKEGTYYWRVAEIRPDGTRGAFARTRRLTLEVERAVPESPPPAEAGAYLPFSDGAGNARIAREGATLPGPQAGGIRTGDTLEVAPTGATLVDLSGGQRLRFLENTKAHANEISLEPDGTLRSNLRLDRGAVLLNLRQGVPGERVAQEVVINGRTYRFSSEAPAGRSAEILVTQDPGGTAEIRVLSGQVRLTGGNEELTLSRLDSVRVGSRGEIVAPKREDPVDLVLSEGVDANVFYAPGLTLVGYEWVGREGETLFQLAEDAEFRRIVNSQTVRGHRAVTSVPGSGVFWWRHRSAGIFSPATRAGFFPAADARAGAFRATVQADGQRITFGSQPPVLTFRWKRVPGIEHYRLEIYRDRRAKQRIYEKEVSRGTSLTFYADFLHEGDYYWRTFAIDEKGKTVEGGEVAYLRLDRNPLAPMLDVEYPGETLSTTERSIVARGTLFSDGELFFNGQVLRKGSAGPFSVRVDLRDGINPIVFKEVGRHERVSYYVRKVILEPAGSR